MAEYMDTESETPWPKPVEYRALVRTPASFLSTARERRRGYVERWSAPGVSKEAVRKADYDLRRSEETWATVTRWQKRTVTEHPWEDA